MTRVANTMGVYLNGSLINAVCNGIELKPYMIWVKVNGGDAKNEPCSPYWTIKDLMVKKGLQDTEEYLITVGDKTFSSHSITAINKHDITEQSPLWLRKEAKCTSFVWW